MLHVLHPKALKKFLACVDATEIVLQSSMVKDVTYRIRDSYGDVSIDLIHKGDPDIVRTIYFCGYILESGIWYYELEVALPELFRKALKQSLTKINSMYEGLLNFGPIGEEDVELLSIEAKFIEAKKLIPMSDNYTVVHGAISYDV